jgi:hypothetical protein
MSLPDSRPPRPGNGASMVVGFKIAAQFLSSVAPAAASKGDVPIAGTIGQTLFVAGELSKGAPRAGAC